MIEEKNEERQQARDYERDMLTALNSAIQSFPKISNIDHLPIEEVQSDCSLKYCRKLASLRERGYSWDKGMLLHVIVDSVLGEVVRIVVPKCRRPTLLKLAHDKSGHIGTRTVADILGKRFMWPNMSADIHHFCQSCLACQKFNRRGQAKAPMIERPVVTEPFEVVAMDIVGPLPQGRGRMCYTLTTICMAIVGQMLCP